MFLWRKVEEAFDIHLLLDASIKDFNLHEISLILSPPVSNIIKSAFMALSSAVWYARNKKYFEASSISRNVFVCFFHRTIIEANVLEDGTMSNSIHDLSVLHRLGVLGVPSKAPRVKEVFWLLPCAGWSKVNICGATMGAPSLDGYGGVYHNSRVFVKGWFAFSFDVGFAFEAELWAAIHALEFAQWYGCSHIWLESNSSLPASCLSLHYEDIILVVFIIFV